VHDVLRTWGAYFGVLLDTWLFGRSHLSRHDGPLSVLRAYTLEELKALARSAGLRNAEVRRHRFQRGVIVRWPEVQGGR
jgi:hypothetical protein